MEQLLTAEQMRLWDRTTIERFAVPGIILMENAGRGFVEALQAYRGSPAGQRVLVVCGKGNNGGDGFVIARHLLQQHSQVTVALIGKAADARGDAQTNLLSVRKLVRSGLRFIQNPSPSGLDALGGFDLIVDALFGTGFTGAVEGKYRGVIEWINRQKACITSVDIPSGVDASDGTVATVAVRAEFTGTMAAPKIGHCVGAGREATGHLAVIDIGVPEEARRQTGKPTYRVEKEDVANALPRRSLTANKYSVGKAFVLAGSRNFTGAPAMTAQAAMRAGSGAVVLGCPISIRPILAKKLTEVILMPVGETASGTIGMENWDAIVQRCSWADAVAIGPGMSSDPETRKLIFELLATVKSPLVLDADGLNALKGEAGWLARRPGPTVITPHTGELGRLTGEESGDIERERVEAARRAAKRFACIVVLKGSPTVTALPDGRAYLNPTGNPGLASIGTGDVLTGVIVGLIAQGVEPATAAYTGVYLHGLAGDRVAARYGQRGLLATDLITMLPSIFLALES